MARIVKLIATGVLAVALFASSALADCVSNYTQACIGTTVCFTATGVSTGPVIPYNQGRKYLLIQSESTTLPLYFAIGNSTPAAPLVAVANVNTIQLPAQSPMPANYELNALQNPNSIRVPVGAISIIAVGGFVPVCFLEHNG